MTELCYIFLLLVSFTLDKGRALVSQEDSETEVFKIGKGTFTWVKGKRARR